LEEEVLEIEGRIRTLKVKEPGRAEYWKVNIVECQNSLSLDRTEIEKIEKWLKKWAAVFPREETLAWEQYGVPSLIVRADYTIIGSEVRLYEIEESPAGIGIATRVIPDFEEKLKNLGWQKVIVIMAPNRIKGGDDSLWTEVIDGGDEDEISKIGHCWLAPRLESLPSSLQRKSIWPVKFREKKRYLVELGLAEEWDRKTPLEQVVNYFANKRSAKGIVFKSDGARAEKVKIIPFKTLMKEIERWLEKTGGIGIWRFGIIKEEVEKWEPLYIQPLHPPMKVRYNSIPMYGIFRIFFAFSLKEGKWKPLGGFLNLRKSLLIHGASDALFIPIST
jgi:hypothetical protein